MNHKKMIEDCINVDCSVLIQRDELKRLYLLITDMRDQIKDLTEENKKLLARIESLLFEKLVN